MKIRFAVITVAGLLSACTAENPDGRSNPLSDAAGALNPTLNAQTDARVAYDKSVAEYRACLNAHAANPNLCLGQRYIMEANERLLSSSVQPPSR